MICQENFSLLVFVVIEALSYFQKIWKAVSNGWRFIRKYFLSTINVPRMLTYFEERPSSAVIRMTSCSNSQSNLCHLMLFIITWEKATIYFAGRLKLYDYHEKLLHH